MCPKLLLAMLTMTAAAACCWEIGFEGSITAGGPLISVVPAVNLDKDLSLSFRVGGFPSIILKMEADLSLDLEPTQNGWGPYIEGGIGYWRFYRGRGDGKSLKDLHFTYGIIKPFKDRWEFFAEAGILYAPYIINPWIREEYPNGAGFTLSAGLGITCWLR